LVLHVLNASFILKVVTVFTATASGTRVHYCHSEHSVMYCIYCVTTFQVTIWPPYITSMLQTDGRLLVLILRFALRGSQLSHSKNYTVAGWDGKWLATVL